MDDVKLYDSELKLMELLWENEPVTAKKLTLLAHEATGWNKNTTYTVIKKLVGKQVIRREEPGFLCTSLVNKSEVIKAETNSIIDKLFDGSKQAFFSALINDENLSEEDIARLKEMIEKR
jgi:BlaI family penicillinase repressor